MKELLKTLNHYLQLIKPYFAAATKVIYEAWKDSGIVGKAGFIVIGAAILFIFCKLLSLPFRKKSAGKPLKESTGTYIQQNTEPATEMPVPKVKITSAYKIDWSKPPVSVRKINWDDGVKSVEKIDWSKVDGK